MKKTKKKPITLDKFNILFVEKTQAKCINGHFYWKYGKW